jgi:CubicO group peptidase (beta-lactamase class C family)
MAQSPAPTTALPAVPGLSAERLARIAPVMEQFIRDGKFPGVSVTVARNGRVAYQQEFGFARRDNGLRLGGRLRLGRRRVDLLPR